MSDEEITMGEVSRNLVRLDSTLSGLSHEVGGLGVAVAVSAQRIALVERVLYGVGAVSVTSAIGVAVNFIFSHH